MKTGQSFLAMSLALLTAAFSLAQEVAFTIPGPQEVVSRRAEWLKTTAKQDHIKIAEALGEEGARKFATRNGYQPLLGQGGDRALRQGFDQVYRAGGNVVVVEAKGGASAVGQAYGSQQGTAEWAVKAAKRMAESARATAAEREAARAVLEAAQGSKLLVQVIRTEHTLGQATRVVLESTTRATAADAKAAAQILRQLGAVSKSVTPAATATKAASQTARTAASTGSAVEAATVATQAPGVLGKATKVAGPVGLVVDGGVRIFGAVETEQKYQAGEISQSERVTTHTRNVVGMAGGWAGAWGGAKGGAAAGTAVGAFFGGVGAPVGAAIGGGIGAVGGYFGGDYLGSRIVDGLRWWWE